MRGILFRLFIFVFLCLSFALLLVSLPQIMFSFSRVLPDNYRHLAEQAMRAEDYRRAAEICRKRINQFAYDFQAQFFLADALTAAGSHKEAAGTIKEMIRRVPAARSAEGARGYEEARALFLLARYSRAARDFFTAGEMLRAAADAGFLIDDEVNSWYQTMASDNAIAPALARVALKLGNNDMFTSAAVLVDKTDPVAAATLRAYHAAATGKFTQAIGLLTSATEAVPMNPRLKLAVAAMLEEVSSPTEALRLRQQALSTTGTRTLPVQAFTKTIGLSATTDTLALKRNSVTDISINTGVFKTTHFLCTTSATHAIGMYPIITLSSNGEEIARAYLDGPAYYPLDIELWPQGAPKSLRLQVSFINDAFDPTSRADRNLWMRDLILY